MCVITLISLIINLCLLTPIKAYIVIDEEIYKDRCKNYSGLLIFKDHISTCNKSTKLSYDIIHCDEKWSKYTFIKSFHDQILARPCDGPDKICYEAKVNCSEHKCKDWKFEYQGNHTICQTYCSSFINSYHIDYLQGSSILIDEKFHLDCIIYNECALFSNFVKRLYSFHCLNIIDWVLIMITFSLCISLLLWPILYIIVKLKIQKESSISRENMRIKGKGSNQRVYRNSIAPNKTKRKIKSKTSLLWICLIFSLNITNTTQCTSTFSYISTIDTKNSTIFHSAVVMNRVGATACFQVKGNDYKVTLINSKVECIEQILYFIPIAEVDGPVEWRCPLAGSCDRTKGVYNENQLPGEFRFSYSSGWSGCLDIIHPQCGRVFLKNTSGKYCKALSCTSINANLVVSVESKLGIVNLPIYKTWTYINSDFSLKSDYHELSNSYNKFIQCDDLIYKVPINEENELDSYKLGAIQCPSAKDAVELSNNCRMDETSLFMHNENQIMYHNPDLRLKTMKPISTRSDFDLKKLYPEFATQDIEFQIKTEFPIKVNEPKSSKVNNVKLYGIAYKYNAATLTYECKEIGYFNMICASYSATLNCNKLGVNHQNVTCNIAYDGIFTCTINDENHPVMLNTIEPFLMLSGKSYNILRSKSHYDMSDNVIFHFFTELFNMGWMKYAIISIILLLIVFKLLMCFLFHSKK